jgi:hypothetical protein
VNDAPAEGVGDLEATVRHNRGWAARVETPAAGTAS